VTDAEFRRRYHDLAVTACEWRAFEVADPQGMAARVFERMDERQPASLRTFYPALEKVVFESYRRAAGGQSILESVFQMPARRSKAAPSETEIVRAALFALPAKDKRLLQLAYWDSLTVAELAELRQTDASAVTNELARAEGRFLEKLARKAPTVEPGDPVELLRSAKPGVHHRNPELG
jgi:DNA-directed RNA polymerase specialized sigma24 family protein